MGYVMKYLWVGNKKEVKFWVAFAIMIIINVTIMTIIKIIINVTIMTIMKIIITVTISKKNEKE